MTPERKANIAARNAQITRIILESDHQRKVLQHRKKTGKTRRPTTKAIISFKTYTIEASSRPHPQPMRTIKEDLYIRDNQSTVKGLIQFLTRANLSSLEELDDIEITVKLKRPLLEHNPHLA